ncbi:MAG: segregation and condensation protein B [Pseudohongiellaceae bacterium]|jgi:segregation and condensation protein B
MLETNSVFSATKLTTKHLENVLEAILFAANKVLSIDVMYNVLQEDIAASRPEIKRALTSLMTIYQNKGINLVEVAGGYRFQTKKEYSTWVSRLWEEKPQKYSRAMLETLALIAYRQPITRGDIEEVRGVVVSSTIMKTLQERNWIKVIGYRDVPGRPSMYATTKQFLDYFNLKTLEELPSLAEIRDIDIISKEVSEHLDLNDS